MRSAPIVLGPFCAWWRGDPLPALPIPAGWHVSIDPMDIRASFAQDAAEWDRRMAAGHRLYVASIDGQPVAYGWVARRRAAIGALALSFALPPSDRYLWDFYTDPRWRGRGIYPLLLQTILHRERDGERFWIGYDAPNVASARGIAKAGFRIVVQIVRNEENRLALVPVGPPERVAAAMAVLGLPLVHQLTDDAGTSGLR
ncbi:MAG: GNAT family N-acetyltransferase [Thermomicrobium sp.]|nr:GNAT family N-acetyltransferase [Thermomicrobium sp.]